MWKVCWGIMLGCFIVLACQMQKDQKTNSIHIVVPYELDTLDPHAKTILGTFAILSNFYEGLVTTDPNMHIRPALAERWENPDPLTWIFHLRHGVKFHSGKDFIAEDVVYSFRRLMSDFQLQASAYAWDIADITTRGPLTVQIQTRRPVPFLLSRIRFVPIVPAGTTSHSLTRTVNGTGPYQFMKWQKNVSIDLSRNEKYWGKKPELQLVSYLLSCPPDQAISLMDSEKYQFIQCNSKKLPQALRKFPHLRMLQSDSVFLKFLDYDLNRDVTPLCDVKPNPFKNSFVRQAIHLGIDRQGLVEHLSIYAIPANQPVPAFVFGFNPTIASPTYDPAKSRELLRAAGLPNGFEAVMHVRKMFEETAVLIQQQLQKIGIRLQLRILPDEQFFEALQRGEMTLGLDRFGPTTGDAGEILNDAIHSVDPVRYYGRYNNGRFQNAAIDQAIEETNSIEDSGRRLTKLQHLMSQVMQELVWIPLYFDHDAYALDQRYRWQPRNDSYIFASEIQFSD